MAWDLLVDRTDLGRSEVVSRDEPVPDEGQVVLRVDRVGVTANNVTYAVFGDAMRYWEFFPAPDGFGRVPLWGFADVVASTVDGVAEGTRVYGYLPTSSHLVVEPTKVDAAGFRDASAHRQALPPAYNSLVVTTADPIHDRDNEDVQVLYRPVFMTSFVLADLVVDAGCFDAEAVVLASASSRTAYGTAFLLDGIHRIGLTSARNRDFTESLGCYDEVRTYDEIDDIEVRPVVYLDMAGDPTVRRRVHQRLAPVHSAAIGATHHDAAPDAEATDEPLPGAAPTFFFAPDQIRKRTADWGADGLAARHTEAWQRFAPLATGWTDVSLGEGAEGLRAAWLATLDGSTPPRTGHVVDMSA
jgi:hypothetical protein